MERTYVIRTYITVFDRFGTRVELYVNVVWGSKLTFDRNRWNLFAENGELVSTGEIKDLHADGKDVFSYNYTNRICYSGF